MLDYVLSSYSVIFLVQIITYAYGKWSILIRHEEFRFYKCLSSSLRLMVNWFSFCQVWCLCTLTLLAYERYNVVCKPRAGFKLNMRRSLQGLLFVWVFCLFWAVPPLFGWSSYGPEGIQTSCSLGWEERSWSNYSYLILYTIICFLAPVAIIIYCYSKVLASMSRVGLQAAFTWL